MRPNLLTTVTTLATLSPTSHAFSFLFKPAGPAHHAASPFKAPSHNWQRGNAKVVVHKHADGELSAKRVTSEICDTHAAGEFRACHDAVMYELDRSAQSYCGHARGRLEECRNERSGAAGEVCGEEKSELRNCEAFINDIYTFCLTYSYSGISHVVDCANIELGLQKDDSHRPLMLGDKRAPEPQAGYTSSVAANSSIVATSSIAPQPAAASSLPPGVHTIPFYTNGSIAFLTTTTTIVPLGLGPVSASTSVPLTVVSASAYSTSSYSSTGTTASSSQFSLAFAGAGRNGSYSAGPSASPANPTSLSYSSYSITGTTASSSSSVTLGGAGRNGSYSAGPSASSANPTSLSYSSYSTTDTNSSTSTSSLVNPTLGGAGRNGSYSAGPTGTPISISYSAYSPVSLTLTSLGAVSSLQAGTVPSDVSVASVGQSRVGGNATGTSTTMEMLTGTVSPVPLVPMTSAVSLVGGDRVGVFTYGSSVCTRYTAVVTGAA